MIETRCLPTFIAVLAAFCGCAGNDLPTADPSPNVVHHQEAPPPPASTPPADRSADREGDEGYLCGRTRASDEVLLASEEGIAIIGRSDDRLLAYTNGRWTLWNTRTRQVVAEGKTEPSGVWLEPSMAGDVAIVTPTTEQLTVIDTRDGRAVRTFATPGGPDITMTGLAIDGSYAFSTNRSGVLTLFSLDGRKIAEMTAGITNLRQLSAQPHVLRVSGTRTIWEMDPASGSVKQVVAIHEGNLEGWFADGEHFVALDGFSNEQQRILVYRRDGQLVQAVPVTDYYQGVAGGYGRFFWTAYRGMLRVYRIGSAEPLLSRALERTETSYQSSFSTRRSEATFIDRPLGTGLRLDMSGDEPRLDELKVSDVPVWGYASDGEGGWSILSHGGVLYDSQTLDARGRPLPIGCGGVLDLAGSPAGIAAVVTTDGRVRVFDLTAPRAPIATLHRPSSEAQLSGDGRRLLLSANRREVGDRMPRIVALPGGETIGTFPFRRSDGSVSKAIVLAESGDRVAQLFCTDEQREGYVLRCSVQLSEAGGRPIVEIGPVEFVALNWANIFGMDSEVRMTISPSGERISLSGPRRVPNSMQEFRPTYWTSVFDGGEETSSTSGHVLWLDDARLLVERRFEEFFIVDYHGEVLASVPPLDRARDLTRVDATHVYSPVDARVFALPEGSVAWQGPRFLLSGWAFGAAAGERIVFRSDTEVRAEKWTSGARGERRRLTRLLDARR